MKGSSLTVAQREVLEELLAQHGPIVSTQEIVAKLTFATDESKYRFVGKLQRAGWLVRIKQGLYQIADLSSLGTLTLSRYTIAHLLHPESYVSFAGALQYHGLFDQALQSVTSVCLKQKTAVHVEGTVYQYVTTAGAAYFGFSAYGLDGQRVQIADPEKAILDFLQFGRTSVSVDLVLETLRDNSHQLHLDRLTEWALRSPIAVQRALGFLLDAVGVDTAPLLPSVCQSKSRTRLTPESAVYSSKWHLYFDPFFVRDVLP
jgi:predicted transcriptional regulator of viral defense system